MLKDVVVRHKLRQPQLLDKLVAFLYDSVGSFVLVSSIVKYMKNQNRGADPETVANYIKYLEDAFIIKSAPPYDVKGKRLLDDNNKFYLGDHSLQYAVRNRRPDKMQAILENIVFMELVRRGFYVYVGKINGKEIDFVAEERDGEQKIYVQVCLEFTDKSTYEREFASLKEIKDHYPKYVVNTDRRTSDFIDDGIVAISLDKFLLKPSL